MADGGAKRELFGVGDVAKKLLVEQSQVSYVLKTHQIPMATRIGGRRAYDAEAVEKIGRYLKEIAARKPGGGVG